VIRNLRQIAFQLYGITLDFFHRRLGHGDLMDSQPSSDR
jgi:hypothetical protein